MDLVHQVQTGARFIEIMFIELALRVQSKPNSLRFGV